MFRFTGMKLPEDDLKCMKEFTKFTLDKFILPSVQKKMSLNIVVIDKYFKSEAGGTMDCAGEMLYLGNDNGIRRFKIVMVWKKINKEAKTPWVRLKEPIKVLAHELVHVKQYLNNQLYDYVTGDVRFEGRVYKETTADADYWESPWEIEAHGREYGIYAQFKELKMKEMKAKKAKSLKTL